MKGVELKGLANLKREEWVGWKEDEGGDGVSKRGVKESEGRNNDGRRRDKESHRKEEADREEKDIVRKEEKSKRKAVEEQVTKGLKERA